MPESKEAPAPEEPPPLPDLCPALETTVVPLAESFRTETLSAPKFQVSFWKVLSELKEPAIVRIIG